MKQDNIPGYPGYFEFNCKNMSRIVRRTKGEIVK